jgi:hypothetical protein
MLRWGTKLFEAVTSEVFHSSKDGGLESKTWLGRWLLMQKDDGNLSTEAIAGCFFSSLICASSSCPYMLGLMFLACFGRHALIVKVWWLWDFARGCSRLLAVLPDESDRLPVDVVEKTEHPVFAFSFLVYCPCKRLYGNRRGVPVFQRKKSHSLGHSSLKLATYIGR